MAVQEVFDASDRARIARIMDGLKAFGQGELAPHEILGAMVVRDVSDGQAVAGSAIPSSLGSVAFSVSLSQATRSVLYQGAESVQAAFVGRGANEAALMAASDRNEVAKVAEQLARGVRPHVPLAARQRGDGAWTPLHNVAYHDWSEQAEVLLKTVCSQFRGQLDAREGEYLHSPLAVAVTRGHPVMADRLMDAGADVNLRDREGLSVLARIALSGNSILFAKAMKCGGDPGVQDDRGWPVALHVVAGSGTMGDKLRMLQECVAAGCDLSKAAGDDRLTALHVAAYIGSAALIEHLARQSGVNVDARAADGRTPLHFAAANNKPAAIVCLAGRGADVNASDAAGLTPASIAAACGHVDALWNLKDAGAALETASHARGLSVGSAMELARSGGQVAAVQYLQATSAAVRRENGQMAEDALAAMTFDSARAARKLVDLLSAPGGETRRRPAPGA